MLLTLVLADQLFKGHPALYTDSDFICIESKELAQKLPYHKFKLAYLFATLRYYKDFLENEHQKLVNYYYIQANLDFKTALQQTLENKKYTKIQFCHIADKSFRVWLVQILESLGVDYLELSTPGFLTAKQEFEDYLTESNQKLLLNTFYIWQRKRLKIFVDEQQKPYLGKWSFDTENRKKLQLQQVLPNRKWQYSSENYKQTARFIQENFADNPGELDLNFSWLPLTHKQAEQKLDEFLNLCLFSFGDVQDAMTNRDDFVFHSVLSPMINNGLLTPKFVLDKLQTFLKSKDEAIIKQNYNSIEGFIRQIIGWREWVKWLYETKYDAQFADLNFFEATVNLPKYFYYPDEDGQELAQNLPLKLALEKTRKLAWAHHIERLMILANWMNLNSYEPKQCYEWFLSQFVDGYEWVMVGNVYGMGLFADGGLFATKPYISGGSYIKKMSDYKNTGWVEIWTQKYWQFLEKHYFKLKDNPRMSLVLKRFTKK